MTQKTVEQAAVYRRWNPELLSDMCGNPIALSKAQALIDMKPSKRPGFILITGPSGSGKSTLAHILLKAFGCGNAITVYNSRDVGKVDAVSEFLAETLPTPSLVSSVRGYIFEEAHNITTAAQEMFMEPLEKGIPADTYVVFVTNIPERLTGGKGALLSRPFRIETVALKPSDMIDRLLLINHEEGMGVSDEDAKVCAEAAYGNMRTAINNMMRLSMVPDELKAEELNNIRVNCSFSTEEIPPNLKDLAVAIETRNWDKVRPVLKNLRDSGDDPEGLRRGLLAWNSGIILSEKAFCRTKRPWAFKCLQVFDESLYSSGWPGFVMRCASLCNKGVGG